MQDFAAIDFETANINSTSVCSVGVVIVKAGKITERIYKLIRPVPNYYNICFTEDCHGLSRSDTDGAADFPEIWTEIAPKVLNLPFVVHNSRFDESCLKAVFNFYGMTYQNYKFFCTCQTAKKKIKGLPNYRLDTVAQYCGYELKNHHHALADAEACAAIAMEIL